MAESSNDFGLVDAVGAEAVGRPGQRTFRLIARSGGTYASIWMEKETLLALGNALQQFIVKLGRPDSHRRAPLLEGSELPGDPQVQFRCGQLALSYIEESEEFTLFAYMVDADENDIAEWAGRVTIPQARSLSRAIEQLGEAGRPKCPLCGAVLEGAVHICPRANGHARELTNG
jgi:uncharacterized repeat protein (TIGR03847 family)